MDAHSRAASKRFSTNCVDILGAIFTLIFAVDTVQFFTPALEILVYVFLM